MSQLVEVDVNKNPKKMPEGLQRRLQNKAKARRSLEKINEKLAGAEGRRNERLDLVKRKAVETRVMLMLVNGQDQGTVEENHEKNIPPTSEEVTVKNNDNNETLFVSSATPEFWNMTHAVGISKWSQPLQDLSLESVFLPMAPSVTKALCGVESTPTLSDKADLQDLEFLLDACIESLDGEAFVKLSSRSGKDDAILQCGDAAAERLKRFLETDKVEDAANQDEAANIEAVAVLKTVMGSLAMTSGKMVLSHFAGSSRVATDLKKSLLYPSGGMEAIVRRFSREIQPGDEWRCFVKNRTLTAISQYHHHCHFPHHTPSTQRFIEAFLTTEVIPHLPVASCVVDVCCNVTTGTAILIELNPFHYTTEGCLFDWMDQTDLQIMTSSTGGSAVFRRRDHPSFTAASRHISRSYRTVVDAWRHEKSLPLAPSPPRNREI